MTAIEAYIKTLWTRHNAGVWISADDAELLDMLSSISNQASYGTQPYIQALPSERNKRILKRIGYKIESSTIWWDNFGMENLI